MAVVVGQPADVGPGTGSGRTGIGLACPWLGGSIWFLPSNPCSVELPGFDTLPIVCGTMLVEQTTFAVSSSSTTLI